MSQTTVTPHLCCRNAAEAVEFYKKALGADVAMVMPGPDGRIMHASLAIDGAPFYVVDEFPEHGGKSPLEFGGTPVSMHVHVSDCDAYFNRAVEAGCEVRMPLEDMFWGDRYGLVSDPYGHLWAFATTKREVGEDELKDAISGMDMANCGAS